jgi:hypothetical protein
MQARIIYTYVHNPSEAAGMLLARRATMVILASTALLASAQETARNTAHTNGDKPPSSDPLEICHVQILPEIVPPDIVVYFRNSGFCSPGTYNEVDLAPAGGSPGLQIWRGKTFRGNEPLFLC